VRPVEAVASVPAVEATASVSAAAPESHLPESSVQSSSVTAPESHLPEFLASAPASSAPASAPASAPVPVGATTTARAPILSGPAHPVIRATSWRRGKNKEEECAEAAEGQEQEQVVQSPQRAKKFGAGTAVHQSHKWVRPATTMHDDGNDDGRDKKVPAKAAANVNETDNAGTVIESSNTTASTAASEELDANKVPAPAYANLKRRGHNKLVFLKGPEESRGHNPSSKTNEMDAAEAAATANEESHIEPVLAAANHQRRGRHKLIFSKGPGEEPNEALKNDAMDATTADTESEPNPAPAAANLKRVGRNRLVLPTNSEKSHQHQHPGESHSNMPFVSSQRGRKRPRHAQTSTSAVPKRIKVAVPEPQEQDDQEGDDGSDGGKREDNGAAVVTEKLTDFTYRETSAAVSMRGRGRGRGRGGGRGGPPARSMGLQRVLPDFSTTPICKYFLRGTTCLDETCTMRHDIPKEFGMPVCSYFQSHGMCLKKECPFRHIKVNPHATVCPSFALRGFCETPGCTMQHNRPKNNNLVWKGGSQG
jgi:hypothetical protein